MSANTLAPKEISRLLEHVERQGVKVTPTTKGYLLRLPNGDTAMVHKSLSDWRAPLNIRARLRQAGIDWPTDHQLGAKFDDAPRKVRAATIAAWRKTLGDPLPSSVTISDVMASHFGADSPKVTSGGYRDQAQKVLLALGYKPTTMKDNKARIWVLEVPEPVSPLADVDPEEHPEIANAIRSLPRIAPAETEQTAEREFVDTVDSWVLDHSDLADVKFGAVARTLAAADLRFELRVWRA